MPWLEERTLILFVRDTQIRRYEPGVREGRVHVEGGSCSSGTSGTRRALPLEGGRHGIVHSHRLVRQHDATHYTSLKQHSNRVSLWQPFRCLQYRDLPLFVVVSSIIKMLRKSYTNRT
jgi:hypothetical protein